MPLGTEKSREKLLIQAILASFDRRKLARLVEYECQRRYDHLIAEGTFSDEVYDLVRSATRENWLQELASALSAARPYVLIFRELADGTISASAGMAISPDSGKGTSQQTLLETLYLLLLIDQFSEGVWGASLESTTDLYGHRNDPGSISVSVSCAFAMTASSQSQSLESAQLFRKYLVSRRSDRGAFGMKRFVGSSIYPVAEILEHPRHTAAATRFFLAYDGPQHDYVAAGISFLLDRKNRTESGLWVEQGEKLDSRVDPVTIANVIECLEAVHEHLERDSASLANGVTSTELDRELRIALKHLFESPFRQADGMWLYRFTNEAEYKRVTANRYRYTAGILSNVARTCVRIGIYTNDVIRLIEQLAGIASRYKGLPASEASNIPSLAATVNLIDLTHNFLPGGAASSDVLRRNLYSACDEAKVVEAGMAPGWAGIVLLLTTYDSLVLTPARVEELQSRANALRATGPNVGAIPAELTAHAAFVISIITRISNHRELSGLGGSHGVEGSTS